MKETIQTFYQAFTRLDPESMVACYHPEIHFEDPAFGSLQGEKAKNMWRMLCKSQKGKDFRVIASQIEYQDGVGSAHWEAFYTFSKTGRKVHNIIDAQFRFEDNLIIEHKDSFDLYRWSKQALGLPGLLLGWSSYFKTKLNGQTNKLLTDFESKISAQSD